MRGEITSGTCTEAKEFRHIYRLIRDINSPKQCLDLITSLKSLFKLSSVEATADDWHKNKTILTLGTAWPQNFTTDNKNFKIIKNINFFMLKIKTINTKWVWVEVVVSNAAAVFTCENNLQSVVLIYRPKI